jgi:hypothetical protein
VPPFIAVCSLHLDDAPIVCPGLAGRRFRRQSRLYSAESAGPDYAIQGEYLCASTDDTWAAQVIALGDGKFETVGFQGGLPGAGWQRGGLSKKAEGELKDGLCTLNGSDFTLKIKVGTMTVIDADGNALRELKKVERKSPTLGAAPPSGAKVLFDGTSADAFDGGKLVEENLLGATGCESKPARRSRAAPRISHSVHAEIARSGPRQ